MLTSLIDSTSITAHAFGLYLLNEHVFLKEIMVVPSMTSYFKTLLLRNIYFVCPSQKTPKKDLNIAQLVDK